MQKGNKKFHLIIDINLGDNMSFFTNTGKSAKTFQELTAADVMETKFKSVQINDSMEYALELITKYKLSGLPVLEDGILVGFISERDCLKYILSIENFNIPHSFVSEYCTKNVLSISSYFKLPDIIKAFVLKPFHVYPVEQDGKCIGIISRNSLILLATDFKIASWSSVE
jgi:predicted transcriptional regulator